MLLKKITDPFKRLALAQLSLILGLITWRIFTIFEEAAEELTFCHGLLAGLSGTFVGVALVFTIAVIVEKK